MTFPDIPNDRDQARAAERERGVLGWYVMTFVDGKERLGSAVFQAYGPVDAHLGAIEANVDPGRGRIFMMPLPDVFLPPEDKRSRLLSPEEADELWPSGSPT